VPEGGIFDDEFSSGMQAALAEHLGMSQVASTALSADGSPGSDGAAKSLAPDMVRSREAIPTGRRSRPSSDSPDRGDPMSCL
jgi:hypothetical protein